MKYFSMYSGIGGFELGIQNAYRSTLRGEQENPQGNKRQGLLTEEGQDSSSTQGRSSERITDELNQRPLCVGYSEIDKYAIKVYERRFSGHRNYGNADTINEKELPDFDLLVGGFPCQSFSIAGKRRGFDDTRGTQFFNIARILAEKRPRYLVLENVKGLLSHDAGKTFQTILGVLADLGYRVEWQVLNSKDFGVPQNRERIYFVGHLRGECSGEVLPITNHSSKNLKQLVGGSQGNRVYDTDGISSTLASQAGGLGAKTGLYAIDLTRRANNNYRVRKDGRAGTLDANYYKGLANQERPGVKEGIRIRRLTPLECERLQGFPDDWTKYEYDSAHPLVGDFNHWQEKPEIITDILISDTQRYKMCGNAVTVNVVQAVMEKLLASTKQRKES